MKIIDYKEVKKGALQGSLTVQVPEWGGLIIYNISVFEKDGRKWISFPSRPFEKDGKTEYFPYLRFEDRAMNEAWQKKVLTALKEYKPIEKSSEVTLDEGLPF